MPVADTRLLKGKACFGPTPIWQRTAYVSLKPAQRLVERNRGQRGQRASSAVGEEAVQNNEDVQFIQIGRGLSDGESMQGRLSNVDIVGNNILPVSVLTSRDHIQVQAPPEISAWDRRKAMVKAILVFAGPALAIPLGDPLMSLIDTVCIGRFSSTLELAAIGPNTLIFQFATYVVASLATACTCCMSESLDKKDKSTASSVLSTSLALAVLVGTIQMAILSVWGPQLVVATKCAPELIGPATAYLKIRALAAPSVLTLMVAQSGLLAQKDSFTPCLGVLVAVVLNVLGDVFLIGHMGMGLVGAAWATVLSQWAGCLATLWCLPRGNRIRPNIGIQKKDINNLMHTFGPATLILLCKNIVYVAVSGTAAALPALQAAAHQPLYGVWSLGGFAHGPLEQASLAFLPSAINRGHARETVLLLLGIAACLGMCTSTFAAGVPSLFTSAFTTDARLYPLIRSVAPQAFISTFFGAIDICSSGVLVASKDLKHLVKVIMVALPLVLLSLAKVRQQGWGLAGVWWTLVLFFAFRALNSLSRIMYLSKKKSHFFHPDKQSNENFAVAVASA